MRFSKQFYILPSNINKIIITREWCFSSKISSNEKVPCNSNEDCIESSECITLSESSETYNSLFRDQPQVSVRASPPSYEINVTLDRIKGIQKIHKSPARLLDGFSYKDDRLGPQNWFKMFPSCSPNQRQSPLNINTHEATRMADWSPVTIDFSPAETTYRDVLIDNFRNYLKLVIHDKLIKLKAPGLKNSYFLKEVYFRFGCESDRGSEHQIDGKKFPLEVQFLFWDNGAEVSGVKKDQVESRLAIVAVLLEEGDLHDNALITFDVLNEAIKTMGNKIDAKVKITDDLEKLFKGLLPDDIKTGHPYFYKYSGLISVPPCLQSVDWFVLADCCKLKVPSTFLQTLRELHSNLNGDLMCDNFRPIQQRINQGVLW
ncbi:carbonic anhydrase 1-like isoform X2 [Hydra vulgaris]|uniref:Carbonic anhydrase 1-like isoform X2 n=1 Tax=Hydra vulgaris TaxID=6087 RepID=A0ABM4BYL7_HYDVU